MTVAYKQPRAIMGIVAFVQSESLHTLFDDLQHVSPALPTGSIALSCLQTCH